jgi:purine catabolism regulator
VPLFTVPYEVPFIAITKYVSSRVFAAHYAGLRRALDLHRRVLGVVTSSGELRDVLAETVRAVGDIDAVIFDSFGHVLARAGDAGLVPDHAALWQALPTVTRIRTQLTMADRVAAVTPLRAADDVQAVMVVASAHPLDEARQLLVEQGAAAATVTLSRGLSARKARRAMVAELLDDVLEGRASRRRLARRLEQLGVDPAGRYHVLTIVPDRPNRVAVLAGMLEDMTSSTLRPISEEAVGRVDMTATATSPTTGTRAAVGTADGVIHAIVQPGEADVGATLAAAAGARGVPPPRIGRSREQHHIDGLAVGLRESIVAAERSEGGVLDVGDVGVGGLLAGVGTDAAADAFVTQVLGPVLAHDADGDSALIDTVRAYLAAGCRPGPAAERLRVHRHTLSYRLDRVAQLTGRDPRSGEHLLSYGMALALLDRRTSSSPA